jgi:ABC-type nitrate/sulfonate/bicarbonate transport system substrate-binding protein
VHKRIFGTWLVLAVAAALLVGACGGGAPAAAPSQAVSAAPTAQPFQGTKVFKVAFTSIGVSSVPLLAAIDALRGQGYTIETPEIAESELSVQGVVKGDFAFSSGTTSAVMTAVQKGGKVKILADRVANEWTVYAVKAVGACKDLDGKKLAIHSEGAVSTAMVKNWLATECPTAKPTILIVPGSDNRLKALLAGQIDSSPLELSDAISLEAQAGDKFRLITSFAQTLPNIHPTTVYANGDFVDKNPDSVKALLKALLEQHRKIAGDAKYLSDSVLKYYKNANKDTLDKAVAQYVGLKMFDVNGGLTEANLKGTLDFFTAAGAVQPGLTVKDVADLAYLTAVLGEIGRK